MAGSIPLSMTQQFDEFGSLLAGGKIDFFQAGTTSTRQNAFKDTALTLPWPNPITLDASGRIPQLFFADGLIKVRLSDKNGINQLLPGGSASGLDNILVVGPSSGGGGGGSIDPTTILATGDIKARYGIGPITGFVRANGRTIGNATSGALERANADCEPLFEYLWGADPNLVVSSGRGASAVADFAASKSIALPDWRGRVLAGLDGMGNSVSNRILSNFGAFADVLGTPSGAETRTLTLAQLPTGIIGSGPATVLSNTSDIVRYGGTFDTANVAGGTQSIFHSGGAANAQIGSTGTATTTSTNTGGQAHLSLQPTMLATIYVKL